ncbi:MAG: S9 family peptidase, partial [Mycobacteriaceae bacterium]|nr:S9 family peptidase [Mycobacteriaceae bacterium]
MAAKTIPLEVLLGNPDKAGPQISPDGTRLSYIAPLEGVLNVWLGTVGGQFEPITRDTDRGIRAYTWCHNNRHLMYLQDKAGDENWHIHTIDLETSEIIDRTPFDGVQAEIIALRREYPNEALIGLNKDNPQLHDVWRLNLETGELTKVVQNPGFIAWGIDRELKVRAAVAPQPDGGMLMLVRDTEDGEWRPFVNYGPEDAIFAGPVGFTGDNTGVYIMSSIGVNAARVLRKNIATGEEEVIAQDPTYDCVNITLEPVTRKPQIAWFLKEKVEYLVLDPSIQADLDAIKNLQPGEFGIVDRDHADETWLIAFDSDVGPVKFYVYDRKTKTARFLFSHKPDLEGYPLAPMEPFTFTTRDGLDVHGYTSFPLGRRENLPTVINVHGGPWSRDSWGFDAEAQWLANRGYLCIQLNFRGSLGYGKNFLNAGDKEWGGKMQDDVSDAVRWAIEQGYADPQRICIYGGSYGGYAALAGATFTPELYKCVIAMCAPANLKSFIESIPPYWTPMIAMFKKRVGDPQTEEEFLWSRSPLSKVDSIVAPMLIAHGANDP